MPRGPASTARTRTALLCTLLALSGAGVAGLTDPPRPAGEPLFSGALIDLAADPVAHARPVAVPEALRVVGVARCAILPAHDCNRLHWRPLVERIAKLHIEKLPEGVYLATCDDIPGLVAQGRTLTETLEIARDVARKLLEAQSERSGTPTLAPVGESFDFSLVVGA